MITLAIALVLVQEPAPPARKPAAKEVKMPAKGTLLIGKQPSSMGKGPSFDISVGDCKVAHGAPTGTPSDCFVYVSLGGKGKEKLPWTAKPGAVLKQGERSVAIGDDAESALGISWAPVTVAKGIDGVIVTLSSGGQRVKHRHEVFLNVRGKLNYALTASEPRGPMTWSSITPLDVDGNGFAELMLMHAQRPDEEEADRWNLDVYGWRADIQKMLKLPSWTPTIHAAVVGSFPSVKDARAMHASKCLQDFMVLDNKSMPLLQDGSYAVVYAAATSTDADRVLEAAKACDEDVIGAVKVLSRGMDVEEKP